MIKTWNKLFWVSMIGIGLVVGDTFFLETTKPSNATVYGVYRAVDNGDSCLTPAEVNEKIVVSQDQELLFTMSDPEDLQLFKDAVIKFYKVPPENLIEFDMQEIYRDKNKPGVVFAIPYIGGCQTRNTFGQLVTVEMTDEDFDQLMKIAGLVDYPTDIRLGFEPKVIMDPRK